MTKALIVMNEVGADMSKFPDDKHFASWLGLCPGTKITGGKVMSGKTARVTNRAAQAFKLAAAALRTSLPVDCRSVDAPARTLISAVSTGSDDCYRVGPTGRAQSDAARRVRGTDVQGVKSTRRDICSPDPRCPKAAGRTRSCSLQRGSLNSFAPATYANQRAAVASADHAQPDDGLCKHPSCDSGAPAGVCPAGCWARRARSAYC